MRRPTTWHEHRCLCINELQQKVWELEERAKALQKFTDGFFAASEQDIPAITELAMRTNVADNEDHMVPAVREIYQQGNSIMSAPGEGYW